MKKMVTLKPHLYAGRRLKVGDVFDVRGMSDARLLRALGRAEMQPETVAAVLRAPVAWPKVEPAPVVAEPVAPVPHSHEGETPAWSYTFTDAQIAASDADDEAALAVATAEHPEQPMQAEPEISDRTGKPKRAYRRRDMRAEGSE